VKLSRSAALGVLCAIILSIGYADVVRAWDASATISSQAYPADSPAIARDDNFVFIAWSEADPQGVTHAWIRVSEDAGASWRQACMLPDDWQRPSFQGVKDPDIGVWEIAVGFSGIAGSIYVVYADQDGLAGSPPAPIYDVSLLKISEWRWPCDFTYAFATDFTGTANDRLTRVAVDSRYAQVAWVTDTGSGGGAAPWQLKHARWDGNPLVPPTVQALTSGYSWDPGYGLLAGPDVSVSSNPDTTVNVAWECWSAATNSWEVYAARSADGGGTWPGVSCTNPVSGVPGTDSLAPSVAGFLTYVHVSWTDYRQSQGAIFYRRSTNGGVVWGTETQISTPQIINPPPVGRSAIASCGLCVGIVWNQLGTTWDLKFKYSLASGDSWLPPLGEEPVTSGSDNDYLPAIAADRLTDPTYDYFVASYHIAFKRVPTVGPPNIQYYRRFSPEMSTLARALDANRWGTSAALDQVGGAWIFGGWIGYLNADCGILRFDTATYDESSWAGDQLVAPSCADTSAVWVPSGDPLQDGAYVFGGRTATGFSDKVLRFLPGQTPGNQVVEQSAHFTTTRFGTSAVFDGTRYAYVFGGRVDLGGTYLDQIARFDTLGGPMFACTVTLPSGRTDTAAVWDPAVSHAYVIGGRNAGGDVDEVLDFDPSTCETGGGTVPVGGQLPASVEGLGVAPRYGFSAVWDATASVAYVLGGECCGGATRFDTILRVRVGWQSYGEGPTTCLPMTTARAYSSAVRIPGTRDVFAFYGSASTLSETSISLYRPE